MSVVTFSRFDPKVVLSLKRGAALDHQTLPSTASEPPRGGVMRVVTSSRFDPKVVLSLQRGAAHDHRTLPGTASEPPRRWVMRAITFSRFDRKVVLSHQRGAVLATLVGLLSEAHDQQTRTDTAFERLSLPGVG